jgi:hypothetical protein
LLFAVADRLMLTDEQTRTLVTCLLRHHREHPEKALDIARFFPDEPESREVLRRFAPPDRRSSASVRETGVHVTEHAVSNRADARQRLFRSAQEERLYAAIRRRYPDVLVVPNAALHAFIAYESVRSRLTSGEREYFFHALVDCVLFDPEDEYRAVACFELDSPLHDDDRQIGRDAMKDRILAVAGVKLFRVRPGRSGVDEETFSTVLETIHLGRRRGA